MTLHRLCRIIRRFLLACALLLFGWWIAVQAGCMTMRTSDADWTKALQTAGQPVSPQFFDVQAPGGRLIHAVSLLQHDTLPWIFFVHGSPGSSDAFIHYFKDRRLSAVANLVSIDRPGFGFTSGFGVPEPALFMQAEALKAVADSLAPGKPLILVGHSLGGPVIARFAMAYPSSTAALVLAGASIDPALEAHPWWQQAVDRPPLRWFTPRALWTSNAEIIPLEAELTAILPLWDQITCPVRVLHAENDRLVPFGNVAFARRMLRHSSDFEAITFSQGDHFFVWTRPDILTEVLYPLIARQRR